MSEVLCLAMVPSKLLGWIRCMKPESEHCQLDHSDPVIKILHAPCKLQQHGFQRSAPWYPRELLR